MSLPSIDRNNEYLTSPSLCFRLVISNRYLLTINYLTFYSSNHNLARESEGGELSLCLPFNPRPDREIYMGKKRSEINQPDDPTEGVTISFDLSEVRRSSKERDFIAFLIQ